MSNITQANIEQTNIEQKVIEICQQAKAAQADIATATTEVKNAALLNAAEAILSAKAAILAANSKDMAIAREKMAERGYTEAFLDRLKLDDGRIDAIVKGLREIAELADPVGRILANWQRPNGLDISRVATPIGVIGVIFESRPNVTADAAALCLKAGNCAILRGGSESLYSSQAILDAMRSGFVKAGLNENIVQIIPFKEREAVGYMLQASDYIDVIIPRGGKGLIKRIIEDSKIPTFQHLDGNCHTYIHAQADLQKAVKVVENAKMRRTGICGATESLVIDEVIIYKALPLICDALIAKGCEIRGDEQAMQVDSRVKAASEEDFATEYLDAVISVKTVAGIKQAIEHIQHYSSHHTEAIITEDMAAAEMFLNRVDSAIVMVNSSTQFADGGEFGMGAEIGIATGKLHARGPVGVDQLCSFKYQVRGNGQVRA